MRFLHTSWRSRASCALLIIAFVAIFAPQVAPYGYDEIDFLTT